MYVSRLVRHFSMHASRVSQHHMKSRMARPIIDPIRFPAPASSDSDIDHGSPR